MNSSKTSSTLSFPLLFIQIVGEDEEKSELTTNNIIKRPASGSNLFDCLYTREAARRRETTQGAALESLHQSRLAFHATPCVARPPNLLGFLNLLVYSSVNKVCSSSLLYCTYDKSVFDCPYTRGTALVSGDDTGCGATACIKATDESYAFSNKILTRGTSFRYNYDVDGNVINHQQHVFGSVWQTNVFYTYDTFNRTAGITNPVAGMTSNTTPSTTE